jgi:hypothetical protein
VEANYKATPAQKSSLHRQFTADSINSENVFEKLIKGSKDWKDWKALLERCPDLSNEINTSRGGKWDGTHAWDDEYRDSYMMEEASLEEKGEKQILARRTEGEIAAAAKAKCLDIIIELAHLRRAK